ncbi:hypothetical protein CBE37_00610 [bacterium TMED277]|mgnify:CR=1 FL=1|nr:MAG: hypothetical protein CBE37_00610 [bacterium TMED277]|tara:strand:+ start:90 stop:347 length:258 start_codon:yes stop_codon:yes gene_type:complete
MIKVKLIYFSRIREVIGKSSEEISVKSKIVGDLIEELQDIGREYEVLKGKEFKVYFAVDQKLLTDLDSSICGAKEIAFFPPMTGG